PVGRLAHHRDALILEQQPDQELADGRRVVGDEDADHDDIPFRRAITAETSDSRRPETQSFLVRKPSAPEAMPRWRSASESRAETSRMGIPSVSGRCRTSAVS